jgi:hypothetical protein
VGLPFRLLLVFLTHALESSSDERYPSLSERFGFGASGGTSGCELGWLHGGWFVDWGARMDPPHLVGRIRPLIPSGRECASRDADQERDNEEPSKAASRT